MSSSNRKNIQLSFDFFVDLYVYAYRHGDPDDLQYQRICICAKEKIEALLRHDLYSLCKSGDSEDARKEARRKYLDSIGLLSAFRWSDDKDVNVSHSFSDLWPEL